MSDTDKLSLNKWLCKIGLHKWGTVWNITEGWKTPVYQSMNDIWTGYHECERCGRKRTRTEIVHSEPLYKWERKING